MVVEVGLELGIKITGSCTACLLSVNSEINNSCICLQLRTSINKTKYIEKCIHLQITVDMHPMFFTRNPLLTIRSHRNLNPYYSIHYHISMIFIILLFSLFTISSLLVDIILTRRYNKLLSV